MFHMRHVFIMDDYDELMPEWLNLLENVVGSEDLSLNISRETSQRDKLLRVIRKNFVKKSLEMFAGMLAEIGEKTDDYKKFGERFGDYVKFGVHEVPTSRTRIARLPRFLTLKSGDKQIRLEECVGRVKTNLARRAWRCSQRSLRRRTAPRSSTSNLASARTSTQTRIPPTGQTMPRYCASGARSRATSRSA